MTDSMSTGMSTDSVPGDVTHSATAPAVVPDRATRVAAWIGWHLPEITGVTVPAVVAVTVTSWAWLASGLVATGWTVHNVRNARRDTATRPGHDHATTTTTDNTRTTGVPCTGSGDVTDAVTDGKAAL